MANSSLKEGNLGLTLLDPFMGDPMCTKGLTGLLLVLPGIDPTVTGEKAEVILFKIS
jgi:hypothetical protein